MNTNLLAGGAPTPKGLVDPAAAARRIRLATYPPAAALLGVVDYFWVVEWDLRGRAAQTQRVLPYPNAHLVFERGRSALHGVVKGAYERTLEGRGRVFGVRFKPGALRPFIDTPLARLTDRTMALDTLDALLPCGGAEAERRVLDQDDDGAMVAAAQALLLLAAPPAPDPRAILAERAVGAAAAEHGPTSVAALCAALAVDERFLQRLFSNYVGVSPKWVIQRFRLQEAMWRLGRCETVDLAALSGRLGFFDQAHFTRNFSKLVGHSPLDYWKSQTAALA
ncbi:MAG TPA: AraC family transcriptional regulator [Janthinobacterium sp.]|nr:AraC family transcriptional regulator [Janthinobacterium sp.]